MLKTKKIIASNTELKLDTLPIVPNSLSAKYNNIPIEPNKYLLNNFSSSIRFLDSSLSNTEIEVTYQVFSFDFSKSFQKRDKKMIERKEYSSINDFKAENKPFTNPWLENSSDLSKSGSITRGISIGNRQDVVVNSDLNLQLDGILFDNFKIKATISDKNIPLQPEGNTQQIQEFDKVFIQLYNDKTKITAGDFDIISPKTTFFKTNKKVLGTQVEYKINFSKKMQFSTNTSVAITKGKFTRLNILPIDGNQGPYRLTNENGDANIIIIGGSERVFVDGVLLSRGINNEYTIDYNLGELTFTSKKIISREEKIVIEFEYTDRHYSRTLLSSFNQWQNNNLKVDFHIYSEQDMKNQSIQPELTNDQKKILKEAGNQFDLMTSPAFDSVSFNTNQVRYKMIDTLVDGNTYDSIFVYSTHPDSAFYAVSFTFMGENNGDYILLNNTINGRIFTWIAPESGKKRGSYNPIYKLVPPQKKQMILGKIDYQISKKSAINIELAFSNFEKNTFAPSSISKNYGGAVNTLFTNKQTFQKSNSSKKSTFVTKINHQFIAKQFTEIEPSKNSEYFRRFNLNESSDFLEDLNIVTTDILYEHQSNGFASYNFNYVNYRTQFEGIQHSWNTLWNKKRFDIASNGINTEGNGKSYHSKNFKHKHTSRIKLNYLNIGFTLDGEQNKIIKKNTDSIGNNSFELLRTEIFIQNPDSAKLKFKLWHSNKNLSTPILNKISYYSNTKEYGVNLILEKKKHTLNMNGIYREAIYSSSFPDKNDFSFTSNINHQSNFLKGSIIVNTYYQTANGREQKKEYQYLKVAKGQGQYIWTDFNSNNVEDLDEFSISPFPDQAEYIRIWLLSTDYIKTISNEYNQTLLINPSMLFNKKNTLSKLASLLKNQTSLFTNNKTTAGPEIGSIPFLKANTDNITSNKSIRNNLYINPSSSIFKLEYIYNQQYSKIFLNSGFENKSSKANTLIIRSALLKKINAKVEGGIINKLTGSEQLKNRNYGIDHHFVETNISYLKNLNFRLSIGFKYTEKTAKILTNQNISYFNQANMDLQLNIPKRGMISSKLSLIDIKYNQEANNPLSIEILEGLSNGTNIIYNITLQTILSKNIQLNANYELRISPQKNMVHVGNISVRAFF